MDLETLYTATKWDVLKLLEKDNLSPIELSQQLGGSLANISQQLRLLEMAGLVTSKRIANRDKGQPRVLYSLAQNSCYVISTTDTLVDKKRLMMNTSHQIVLKIWFLEQEELRRYAEKAFWKIEEHLPNIQSIHLDPSSTKPLCLYVVAQEGVSIPEIQMLRHGSESRQLVTRILSKDELEGIRPNLTEIYQQK